MFCRVSYPCALSPFAVGLSLCVSLCVSSQARRTRGRSGAYGRGGTCGVICEMTNLGFDILALEDLWSGG
ncbi:hypothetical protein GBA52_025369 [Prunus armeniaca]|nr:hypothetical protein GBA52_025369 [Prunus armeniaca]